MTRAAGACWPNSTGRPSCAILFIQPQSRKRTKYLYLTRDWRQSLCVRPANTEYNFIFLNCKLILLLKNLDFYFLAHWRIVWLTLWHIFFQSRLDKWNSSDKCKPLNNRTTIRSRTPSGQQSNYAQFQATTKKRHQVARRATIWRFLAARISSP